MKKSSPIGFVRLHRIHAGQQATRVEFNGISMTWRGEGGDPALKEAIAYRLALCWNVLEGIPSAQLELGVVRDVIAAVQDGDLAKARELADRAVDVVELIDGRPSDCQACVRAGIYDDQDDDQGEADEP